MNRLIKKSKLQKISKSQQKIRSNKLNVLPGEGNKIALDSKRIQSNKSIEMYSYKTSKDIIPKKEEIS